MGAMMQSDKPERTLLITVGTQGVCVFAWEGLTDSELEDAVLVIQEFVAFKRPNSFAMNGERTGKKITVQAICTKATLNRDGENEGRKSAAGAKIEIERA
jgi:hypothetical protein